MKYTHEFMRKLLFSLFLAFSAQLIQAQKPAVIHFADLEARLAQDNDTLYVVNFWATWCRPCVAEMPFFDAAQKDYGDDKVKILFVSLDFAEDIDTRLVPFLERKAPQSEVVLLDEPKYNTWIDKVAEEWSGAIPATIFVKQTRNIRTFHEGDYTQETLNAQIESLIN